MNILINYVLPSVMTVVSAIVAYYIARFEKKAESSDEDKLKVEYARKVVNMVEQVYAALDGKKKKQKAVENLAEMLTNKGIPISKIELEVLIEDAVATFNEVWTKEKNKDGKDT